MNLFLIRHAECQRAVVCPGAPPYPYDSLSALGHFQAQQLAARLEAVSADVVISSEYVRAYETAAIVAKHLGLLHDVQPIFAEWRFPSCILGKPPEAFSAGYLISKQQRLIDPDAKFEDGESLTEVMQRVRQAKRLLVEQYSGKTVLVVSHFNFIRFFCIHEVLGACLPPSLVFSLPITVENTGVSQFCYNSKSQQFKLQVWNDCLHLQSPAL